MLILVAFGLVLEALFIVFTVLVTNYPPGYQVVYGLDPHARDLFAPISFLPSLALDAGTFRTAMLSTIAGLWLASLAASLATPAVQTTSRGAARNLVWVGLGCSALFHFTLVLLLPPVLSSDVFGYAAYGRALGLHNINPYQDPPATLVHDPILPYVAWPHETSRYGPLWLMVSAVLARIAPDSILETTLVFKVAAALSSLAVTALVGYIAERLYGSGLRATVLYGWNPLVIVETAGSGHNEATMAALALGGLALTLANRVTAGLVLIAASAWVKYLTGVLLLLALALLLRLRRAGRIRGVVLGRAVTAVVLGTLVIYLPFVLTSSSPSGVALGLLTSLNSLPQPITIVLRDSLANVLQQIGSPASQDDASRYLALILNCGFAGFLLAAVWTVYARRLEWGRAIELWGALSLVYVVIVYGGTYPWYVVPLMAMGSIGPPQWTRNAVLTSAAVLGAVLMAFYGIPIQAKPT